MTRAVLLLATAAIGCRFSPPDGGADAPAGTDAGDSDAGGDDTIDAALPDAHQVLDTDGDGLPDTSDNCPSATNADQANEDGDDRGDACDLCPHRSGAVPGPDADSDGDGIGDQCDPRVGADRLVVFLPFNAVADQAAFQLRAGANQWSISGGRLHQDAVSVGVPQQTVWTGEAVSGTVVVETRVHVDGVPSPGTAGNRLAAVVGGYWDGSPVDAYACGLRGVAAGSPALITAVHYEAPPTVDVLDSAPYSGTMDPGAQGRVTLTATDLGSSSNLGCVAETAPIALAVSGFVPDGFPGFRTLGTVASFDYLWVVAVGP